MKKKRNTNNEKRIILIELIIALCTIVLSFINVYFYMNYYMKGKIYEYDEIKQNSISNGIKNVYDSVVIVENHIAGKLYATGSGFLYKNDNEKAYIITNYHVIDSANEVYIVLTNNERIKTKIVGYDKYQDIAVLSIDKDITNNFATINKSDINIGEEVFIIGTPINSKAYSWTITKGIISGKNRLVEYSFDSDYLDDESYYLSLLQTDAAINSGNSGGPLCNRKGEVIGIINLKVSSNNVESIGFAIPIKDALYSADKIIKGEAIIRPELNFSIEDNVKKDGKVEVKIRTISEELKEKYNLDVDDVITKIDDKEIENSAHLKYIIRSYNIGDEVTITYVKGQEILETKIVLETK